VPVELKEPVPVALDVPVALPLILAESVDEGLPVPERLREDVPVPAPEALGEAVCAWLPVPVALLEPMPVTLDEGELVCVAADVRVSLAEPVAVRLSVGGGLSNGALDSNSPADSDDVGDAVALGVCEPDGLPVLVFVMLADSVPVALDDGVPVWVPVPVVLDEPVPVWLPVPVALPEPVPVELLLAVPVAELEPVPVRDALPVLVTLLEPVPVALLELVTDDDGVLDGVRVCDGVCVGVMVGARKHGRTLSISSTDGSPASNALAMRMTSVWVPAEGRLTLKRAHPLRWYAPTLAMLMLVL
jgi:hypothetical protein